MAKWNPFKSGGDTIKGAAEGVGTLAKDIRQAVTGDDPALNMKMTELAGRAEELAAGMVTTEMKGNWLQRSWRPILALVCTFVIFMQYGVEPVVNWLRIAAGNEGYPPGTFSASELWPIVIGLITYRSYEKTAGIRKMLDQS